MFCVLIGWQLHRCMCAQSLSHGWLFGTPWTEPTRLLCPWNFPGKNTGVGCHIVIKNLLSCYLNKSILFYANYTSIKVIFKKSSNSSFKNRLPCLGTDRFGNPVAKQQGFSTETCLSLPKLILRVLVPSPKKLSFKLKCDY